MSRLDAVNKKTILDAEPVIGNLITKSISVGDSEGGYAAQLIWENGSTPSMVVKLEASLDGINFVEIDQQTVTGVSGTELWDVSNTYVECIRFNIVHTSGSADITILFSGKARH